MDGYFSTKRNRFYQHTPAEERFWRRVTKDAATGCWVWPGANMIVVTGSSSVPIRRFVWELVHGQPVGSAILRRTCDNPLCVNPQHAVRTALQERPKPVPRRPLEERLWANIDKAGGPDACWPWQGSADKDGYGRIARRKEYFRAHRLVFELVNGPIGSGLWVLHKCDNPPCCNPKHLFLGTFQDNNDDRDAKGRYRAPRGEEHGNAKVTAEDVKRIFALRDSGCRHKDIADLFGISRANVGDILRGKSWKHLQETPAAKAKIDV